ncbi:MAG: hypothetical protein HY075_03345, partial [Deltaproteobacteria bacterium]|nr:hypothetical protein [Deltaproteobacteria bacterium]
MQTRSSSQERDIRLYMFLRLLLLWSVLISLVAYNRFGSLASDTVVKTYFVTFFTYLVTTGFVFLYEKARDTRYFLTSQIAYDILFTTVLIFYTGPFESMYTVFYLFNIMFAAILFPRAGALLAAIASASLYATIAWINADSTHEEKGFSILTTITGFISMSLLASQLVEELRKSRSRISRLEELSEEIVNSLDSGLLGLDSRGVLRKVNRTAQGMLGIENDLSVLGRPVHEVLPAIGDAQGNEVRNLSVRGEMRRMLTTKVLLPEGHSMILIRDLTEVLDLEEKVRRQDHLAGIGRLATGVAHEIRNPIAAISGAAQLLAAHPGETEEQTRLHALIVRESERVDRLVNQLLRFSRPPIAKRDAVRLDEVLNECIESLRTRPDFKDHGIRLEVEVPGHLQVKGNRDELSEVMTNLLVNSMQALVDIKNGLAPFIRVRALRDRGEIRVVVEDNGPGIPRELRGRVFDPFFT